MELQSSLEIKLMFTILPTSSRAHLIHASKMTRRKICNGSCSPMDLWCMNKTHFLFGKKGVPIRVTYVNISILKVLNLIYPYGFRLDFWLFRRKMIQDISGKFTKYGNSKEFIIKHMTRQFWAWAWLVYHMIFSREKR